MSDPLDTVRTLDATFASTAKAVQDVVAKLDEAERERALLSLVSAYSLAQEMWIFKADPARPAFTDWMAHGRKTAGDSPWTVYLTTPVSPRHSYRVRGNLGDAAYFGMQLYRQVQGFNAPSAQLAQDGLVVDSGGDF